MQTTRRSGSSPVLRTLLASTTRLPASTIAAARPKRPGDTVELTGKQRGKQAKHPQASMNASSAGAAAALTRTEALAQLGAQVALETPYPKTPRGDVVDDFHGTKVADPYRWLETKDAKTVSWANEQNAFTRAHLDKLPARGLVADWMKANYAGGEKGRERRVGGFAFYSERKGGEEQPSLYVRDKSGKTVKLVDPVAIDPTATMHIGAYTPSEDGTKVAVSLHDNGSDWATWLVFDTVTGKQLPETIRWTKENSVEWNAEGTGFYYSGLPKPQPGRELEEPVHDMQVRFHAVGTEQSADVVIHATPENPDLTHSIGFTDDKKWMVLQSGDLRTGASRIAVRPAGETGEFRTVLESSDAEYQLLGDDGGTLYMMTDAQAPRGRLIAMDITQSPPVIRELLPQDAQMTLGGAYVAGERVYAKYLHNGTAALRVFHKGSPERTIELPDRGTVGFFYGDAEGKKAGFSFQNHYTPEIEYSVDLETGVRTITRKPMLAVDPADYVTSETFYKSADGTLVPMFVTQRRDTQRDGEAPGLLYAYGGFRADMTPTYSRRFHAWLELGGVVAVPQLRGGREDGESWHKSGNLARKQNVFEDFKAAARHLVEQRYTKHERLALAGASNGGLLVAATVIQDPTIAAAGLVGVGVHDMLRYHLFTWGPGWIPEYGVSSNPAQFPFLHAYSPYHNVRNGVRFPHLLVETGTSDDRVDPSHSYKLLAALQAAQAGKAPTLLRLDQDTGHGAGKPVGKVIDQTADEIAFALNAMNANGYAANLLRKAQKAA